MPLLNDYDRGWLEAMIDGEGCLGLYTTEKHFPNRSYLAFTPSLHISNTSLLLIEKARRVIGAGSISKKTAIGRKPLFDLIISSTRLRTLLPQLELVAKERQRLLVLEALSLLQYRSKNHPRPNTERLLEIKAKLHDANRKYMALEKYCS